MEQQSDLSELNTAVDHRRKVIELIHLKKSFGDRVILRDVNLTLHDKENLVVLGRSGTGKSVLIKCIVGLLRPDSGIIRVFDSEVLTMSDNELHALRLQVGFSFQGSALYDSMTIRENLEFPLRRNLGIHDTHVLLDRVITALQEVGLERTLNQKPSELSGGMKKRIGIARTLILKPKIMLYDEPTSGLDPVTSEEINELIMQVREKHNTASIIITHDISCARYVSDRIVALIDGESKLEGTFQHLKETQDKNLKPFFNY